MFGRDLTARRSGRLMGFLDIGSSKNTCLIALPDRGERRSALGATIVGAAVLQSRGVKSGVVTDFEEAAHSVRSCISQAESMAGDTLDQVTMAFSCGRIRSQIFSANSDVPSVVVTPEDISKCLRGGQEFAVRDGRKLVHFDAFGFRLDGQSVGSDPRGMAASKVSADMHAVTADDGPLRNMALLVEKCFLVPDRFILAPYASAIAATTAEERRLGVTSIDIGAGTIKIAMFSDGHFVHADVIPVGSDHITFDIARELQTSFAEAKRIKALYGTLVSAQSDSHETFSYSLTGNDEGSMHHSTKAALAGIISHRAAMIASLIGEKLDRCGMGDYVGDRIVLTGGGAQLVGMAEFMANRLSRSVRVAKPCASFELPKMLADLSFSTAVGMVAAEFNFAKKAVRVDSKEEAAPQGYLGRVGHWLMAGF